MRRGTFLRIDPSRAAWAVAVLVIFGAGPVWPAEVETVVVGFVGAADSPSARGAALGIEEATRAARYFGLAFDLDTTGAAGALVIAATRDAAALSALAGPDRVVVDALSATRAGCREGLFHVAPSDAMVASARVQWKEVRGGAVPAVAAWHPSLVKFAARDLNKRYRARYNEAMESDAWGAWAAARSIGEAVLRTRSADPVGVAAYFLGDFSLDGQKGSALSFRANGQLRQPLYYVDAGGEVVGQAPLPEGGGAGNLDSLGNTGCEP